MPDRGFMADADYFHLVAGNKHNTASERINLLEVERAYRRLAKAGTPFVLESRSTLWRKRAQECRTLALTFNSPICITQLKRLADAYDLMATANDLEP